MTAKDDSNERLNRLYLIFKTKSARGVAAVRKALREEIDSQESDPKTVRKAVRKKTGGMDRQKTGGRNRSR